MNAIRPLSLPSRELSNGYVARHRHRVGVTHVARFPIPGIDG
jgi:hypothetical protein